jgi:thiol:disulfide interchange protein DsbD
MQTFRQLLAFPMYATAAWLTWVLAQQAGVDAVLRLLLSAVLVSLAAWLFGRFVQPVPAPGRRAPRAAALLSALACAGSVALLMAPVTAQPAAAPAGLSGTWQPWSEAAVSAELARGRTVFVDFTAAWCVTCQANKKLVLEREPVASELARRGVALMRADWTQRDPAITAALARHGRNGVPMYLVHRPGSARAQVLPELLSAAVVLDAVR